MTHRVFLKSLSPWEEEMMDLPRLALTGDKKMLRPRARDGREPPPVTAQSQKERNDLRKKKDFALSREQKNGHSDLQHAEFKQQQKRYTDKPKGATL